MGYFPCIVVFFLLAGTFCQEPEDMRDCPIPGGGMLRHGERGQIKCQMTCTCHSGLLTCTLLDCYTIDCWDSTLMPGQCCRTCPNGRNCVLPGGGLLIAGSYTIMTDGRMCTCPEQVIGQIPANCTRYL